MTAVLVLPLVAVSADVLQVNRDTYVDAYFPEANYGGKTQLIAGVMDGTLARAYLNFDTSAIAADNVEFATLAVYVESFVKTSNYNTSLMHRAPAGTWTEDGLTWNTQQSPYDEFEAHMESGDSDYDWEFTDDTPGWHYIPLVDETTDLWESTTDYGFVFAGHIDTAYQGVFMSSREGDNAPYIDLTYSGGEPIPEPCTLALMGVGLGGLLLKQRRERA
jgi:hypothetical protein